MLCLPNIRRGRGRPGNKASVVGTVILSFIEVVLITLEVERAVSIWEVPFD